MITSFAKLACNHSNRDLSDGIFQLDPTWRL